MNPSMKNLLENLINGEEHRGHPPVPVLLPYTHDGNGLPTPVQTSNARTKVAFPVSENMAEAEMKRNVAQMDETKHTKQRFKMPVSTMSAACSICNKTSQSGVGGICKGCWNQFQAKGVRIGNMEEFMQFTETVKSNVSRIVTVKNNDEPSSSNQAPIVDSLREVIPSMFFRNKPKKSAETMARKSNSKENLNSGGSHPAKKALSRSSANGDESTSAAKQNAPSETPSRAESIDNNQGSHKPALVRNQSISRSKTFVDSSKSNPSDSDSKQKHEEERSTEVTKKVSRTKTQINMKSNSDRSLKSNASDSNTKTTTEKSQSIVSEKAPVNTTTVRCKRSESDHGDPGKLERGSRTQINEKKRYEPTTVRESSKLNLSKFDNRDRKTDLRYSNSAKTIAHKRSDHRANSSRTGYDNTIKLGTRSMKGNALRQMAGNSEHRSSTDEDTDDDNKPKKDGYKQLDDIKMPTHKNYRTSIKDKANKKNNPKEVKSTNGYKCPFSVQNKYSSYSQLNTEKTDEHKHGDEHNPNESIYFADKSLVSTLSNFIQKNECFKTPAIENTSAQFQQQAKDLYYNNSDVHKAQKFGVNSTDDFEKLKSKSLYFDKPASITADVSSDYTVYKQGVDSKVPNYQKAIEFGTTNTSATSSAGRSEIQESIYTEGSYKYGSYGDNSGTKNAALTMGKNGSSAVQQYDNTLYTGGLYSKSYETKDHMSGKNNGFIEGPNKDNFPMAAGESYSGLKSITMMRSSEASDSFSSRNSFDAASINQHIIKPIFPRQSIEAQSPVIEQPTLTPTESKEQSSTDTRRNSKSNRMFRKRNKAMDEMMEKSIDSAGEFFTKAMVSFKNPFNNFNSNSNLWYGNERNALTGACQDDMSFEKPNYTEWKPEIKPIFQKPKPKKSSEPLVLDFLKYERENEGGYEERYERDDDIQTDEWYAGTQEGFHGPVNTTWDGRNWQDKKETREQVQEQGTDEENEEYTDKKHCRVCPVCPNNNNSTLLVCNINNNYPDYDKYDKPMVQVQKKVPKVESFGNDRDYAPMLYSVPDNFMHKQAPSPVSFKPPSPPVQKKSYESSYFFVPQSQVDEEPEYAGYEKKREIEIPKEPSPPPVPKIIKVGSIFIRNNVENDFDYAENVNRDLNDESFGAMGFNQRAQEFNTIPFPHATAQSLMTDSGNLVQIQDVHQAIHRDGGWATQKAPEWATQKAPVDVMPAYLPARSVPIKMEMPPQKDHEEPSVKKISKSSKTRTTSVTSDAVHRRGGAKETRSTPSTELEPIKKPTFQNKPNRMSSSQNKQSTPRPPVNTQRKEFTPKSKPPESRKAQPARHSYNDSKRKDKNNKDSSQTFLFKVFKKPLQKCGIIGEDKSKK